MELAIGSMVKDLRAGENKFCTSDRVGVMVEALSNHENLAICWNTVKLSLPKCKKEKDMSAISRKDLGDFPWEKLSYFFGAWLGDGWYSWNPFTRSYAIGIKCMDFEILSKCRTNVSSCITDLKPCCYEEITPKGTKLYRTVWYNKDFTSFVVLATAAKTQLPDYIWNSSKNAKLELLAGLLDTDGSIIKQKSSQCRDGFFYRVTLSGTKVFMTQIPDLLRMLKINLTGKYIEEHLNPRHAKRMIISISLPSLIKSGFMFYCFRKQHRLEDAISRNKSRYSKVSSETIRQTANEQKI